MDAQQAVALRPRLARPGDDTYPRALVGVPDPPQTMYWIGVRWPPPPRAVAVVGSRSCTGYGLEVAGAIAGDLARAAVCVVSGMARGVDAAAHRGALAAGGETVAVLAASPGTAYPPDMIALHEDILRRGAVCAEYASGPLRPGLFVRRNRIVSGLALGVLVVEAGPGSGALATARAARRQGRFVAAVPGDVTRDTSWGTLALLRAGAVPVGNAGHLLALVEEACHRRAGALPDDRAGERDGGTETPEPLVATLRRGARSADEIARALGWSVGRVQAGLAALEMAGAVLRLPGGRYERTRDRVR